MGSGRGCASRQIMQMTYFSYNEKRYFTMADLGFYEERPT